MKLYYSPGACSLADHIALHEAGMSFEHEKVDLKTKRTEGGADYREVNPKGYVPALALDSGEVITENAAILDWISSQSEALAPEGPLGRTRLVEALSYISGEIHKSFHPLFVGGTDDEKAAAKKEVADKFAYIAGTMRGDHLFGDRVSAADFYLFVTLTWADKMGIEVPAKLAAFRDRMKERESVKKAMAHEGLV